MKKKIKIGDRVKFVQEHYMGGYKGTVKTLNRSQFPLGIKLDQPHPYAKGEFAFISESWVNFPLKYMAIAGKSDVEVI